MHFRWKVERDPDDSKRAIITFSNAGGRDFVTTAEGDNAAVLLDALDGEKKLGVWAGSPKVDEIDAKKAAAAAAKAAPVDP